MTPKAREVLDYLDDLFSDPGQVEAATEVWDVITALRGPDTFDHEAAQTLKLDLTIPIRRAAFPKTAAVFSADDKQRSQLGWTTTMPLYSVPMFAPTSRMNSAPTLEGTLTSRINQWKTTAYYKQMRDAHFLGHIRAAIAALGWSI